MEEIENAFEELRLTQLLLCPSCYLVVWRDDNGMHFGQGSPVGYRHPIVET